MGIYQLGLASAVLFKFTLQHSSLCLSARSKGFRNTLRLTRSLSTVVLACRLLCWTGSPLWKIT
jgi:hypothetical protein